MNAAALLTSLLPGALPMAGAPVTGVSATGAQPAAGGAALAGGVEGAFAQALAAMVAGAQATAAPTEGSTGAEGLALGKQTAPGQTGIHPHGGPKPGKSLLAPGHLATPGAEGPTIAAPATTLQTAADLVAAPQSETPVPPAEALTSGETDLKDLAATELAPQFPLQPAPTPVAAPPTLPVSLPKAADESVPVGLQPDAGVPTTQPDMLSGAPRNEAAGADAAPVAPISTTSAGQAIAPAAAEAGAEAAAQPAAVFASAPVGAELIDTAAQPLMTQTAAAVAAATPMAAEPAKGEHRAQAALQASPTDGQAPASEGAPDVLARTPAPQRSQAPEHAARPTPHPLAQALAGLKGEVLAVTGVSTPEATPLQDAAGEAIASDVVAQPVAANGEAAPETLLAAAKPPLSPHTEAATAAPKGLTGDKPSGEGKTEAKPGETAGAAPAQGAKDIAPKADPQQAASATAAAQAPAATEAKPAEAFEAPVLQETVAETRQADVQAQQRLEAAAERGAPETVAKLAAQILRKLEQRNTRFELSLDPAGLGGVQVSLEINARGELAAHMSFERPEAAAELRGRAQELHRALEQAGFELGRDALSFEHGGRREFADREHAPGQDRHKGAHHGRAFEAALNNADRADVAALGAHSLLSRARPGVNISV